MCVIIAKNQGTEAPTMEMLQEAWLTNPDGAGVLFRRSMESKYTIFKGFMNWLDFASFVEEMDFQIGDFVAYHFRITTSGGTSRENCHPFPISQKNEDLKSLYIQTDKAIVHNGILFNPKQGDYSDTQIFTRYLAMGNLFDLSNVAKRNKINKLSKGNRLLMVENDQIIYTGNWIEDKTTGLMLSNDHFQYYGFNALKSDNWGSDNYIPKIVEIENTIDQILYDEGYWVKDDYICDFIDNIEPIMGELSIDDITMAFYAFIEELGDEVYKDTKY